MPFEQGGLVNTSPWRLDWPAAGGSRLGRANIKTSPRHFFVDEQLMLPGLPGVGQSDVEHQTQGDTDPIAVSGAGEHLCLRIEKCGDNTDYVARELALLSGCKPHDIGLCGLKDRHAVTRQWLSVYRPGMMTGDEGFIASVRERWSVLSAHRVPRKLRRGEHRANRFEILVSGLEAASPDVEVALKRIAVQGCPNYFGAQRFGWAGNNLAQAVRMNPRQRRGKNSRDGLYFSAARSWLFNEILAERVVAGNWLQPLPGEPVAEAVTGPLWGDGGTTATEVQGELERAVVARHPDMAAVFSQTRMKPERRSLALVPAAFTWRWPAKGDLLLSFELAPGQFATAVLQELFDISDGSSQAELAAKSETGHIKSKQ